MATDVYRGLSKYTHCSYAALLDCIDVYNHDYDWNKYAGYHYTNHNLKWLTGAMTTTIVTYKATYLDLKDNESFEKIDKILIDFAGQLNEETLKELKNLQ